MTVLSAPRGVRWLNHAMVASAIAVGVLDTWFFRQWNANPDGVSYIDLARAFAARGPGELVNGYWSPLYPAVIGLMLKVVKPSMETLYPLVRTVGLLTYVVAVLAFARMMRVLAARRWAGDAPADWSYPAFIGTGWALFFLLVSQATGLHLVTPDIGVAAVFFFMVGEIVTLERAAWPTGRWLRFGVVCALGYWWKAILFPVAGLALIVAAWIAIRHTRSARGPALAALAFGALALVVAVPVSKHVGRATFGETGRVNQLWFVSNVPMVSSRCLAQEGTLARGDLGAIERDSVVHRGPLACATTSPVAEATLPMWFDPSPFYADVHGKIDAAETLVAARNNVRYLRDALAEYMPFTAIVFMVVVAAAVIARVRTPGSLPLATLCLVPVAAYLVVYVELRHVVPFLVCIGLLCLLALTSIEARWARSLVALAAMAAGAESVVRLATQQRVEAVITVNRFLGREASEQRSVVAARELVARGLVAGDAVATINTMWNVDWAQRAGLVVRAYVPEYTYPIDRALRELSDPCARESFLGALRARGIKAVVLREVDGFDSPSWLTPLGSSGYRAGLVGEPESALSCTVTRSSSGTAAH